MYTDAHAKPAVDIEFPQENSRTTSVVTNEEIVYAENRFEKRQVYTAARCL